VQLFSYAHQTVLEEILETLQGTSLGDLDAAGPYFLDVPTLIIDGCPCPVAVVGEFAVLLCLGKS